MQPPSPSTAEQLVRFCAASGLKVTTAESCTGGLVAKCITDIDGSSACFESGFVTYSDAAKQAMIGVSANTLEMHGAVSEAVVREMAEGALQTASADLAVAISGIAGPGGGSAEKPVGTVWIAWASGEGTTLAECFEFPGGREAVRAAAAEAALAGLMVRAAAQIVGSR